MKASVVQGLYRSHPVISRFAAEFGTETSDQLLQSRSFSALLTRAGDATLVVGDQDDLVAHFSRYRAGMQPLKAGISRVDSRIATQPLIFLEKEPLRDAPELAASHLARRLWDAAAAAHNVHRAERLACEAAYAQSPEAWGEANTDLMAQLEGTAAFYTMKIADQLVERTGLALPSLYAHPERHRDVRESELDRRPFEERRLYDAMGQSILDCEHDNSGRPWREVLRDFQQQHPAAESPEARREFEAQQRRCAITLIPGGAS